jgi:asparagine synthase (glutamine-hydrolysing)
MCGITFVISDNLKLVDTESLIDKMLHRGPDDEKYMTYKNKVFFGFNRLAINDASPDAMQPFVEDGVWLICNGEIFNWKQIAETHNLECKTQCDCEVIIKLYKKLREAYENDYATIGKKLSNILDGEFSFVIYDEETDVVIASRDPYGVRPMFVGRQPGTHIFCSEMKGIQHVSNEIEQFKPGHVMVIQNISQSEYHEYHKEEHKNITTENMLTDVNRTLREAVKKRLMSDREVCCLLSGGLDSSLVAGLVSQHFPPYTLRTFAIGLKGSTDLEYAKIVADYIKSNHTSIELSNEAFLEAIEDVIWTIESYDTTTVRASVGNYLVAKYIKENTDCKVVFNGDYSDEVTGGYKYMSKCDDPEEFHKETLRLTKNIHFFDSLRSDRCVSSQGLEARVPFADKEFISTYLSIPVHERMSNHRIEKYVLRKAFDNDNVIPQDVLWRKKEAFSDGVSSPENSWHRIIQMYIDEKYTTEYHTQSDEHNPPVLRETQYYKTLYKKYFKSDTVIPYYWLPKYCGDIQDPSARAIV